MKKQQQPSPPKSHVWKWGKGIEVEGYLWGELEKWLGVEQAKNFKHWMRGQAVMGTPDHTGTIVFVKDWQRYLRGMDQDDQG